MIHNQTQSGALAKAAPLTKPIFGPIIDVNGRKYIQRGDLEGYKAALIQMALGASKAVEMTQAEYATLVPLKTAAAELGVGRRTIGRRIVETRNAVAA
jgi:hypothetical protein